MTIEECKTSSHSHTIIVNNARYQKDFSNNIEKVLKHFLLDEVIFFGFCRIDGINLSREQQKNLKNAIPAFFGKNGDIQNLSEHLAVAKITSSNHNYYLIPSIFDYYLETIMFNPKVDWETFKQYHFNYQEHRFDDIILNHYAEMVFCYFDSGDFLVCFNPQRYNPGEVRRTIEERLLGSNQGTVL